MRTVDIDRGKRLKDQPNTGHNRFHPDIPPLVTVDEGEEVVLATRDGVDGRTGRSGWLRSRRLTCSTGARRSPISAPRRDV